MTSDHVARASVTIQAPLPEVWDALVNPETVRRYMFGATVVSDWRKGSPIVWKGEWKGKPFEDKGVVLEIEPERRLRYSHFSPVTGQADRPENYHEVTIDLSRQDEAVRLDLSQTRNATAEARKHSEESWSAMLDTLKKLLEA
jgi:uncharacterized protein YndB with AHSA1/START domain